jgi:1-deoxy-D-xylulose-5-phosphate reductoisomerase
MKRLAILGSTGSIGCSTLDVVRAFGDRFSVGALAAGRDVDALERQVQEFRPECVAVADADGARELAGRIRGRARVVAGEDGLIDAATTPGVDLVVSAIVGAAGLRPTYAALDLGLDVALANKESLVVAGEPMTRRAKATGAALLPVDSEHNALHQCLRGERDSEVRKLWLTASGGPFRQWTREALQAVTPDQSRRAGCSAWAPTAWRWSSIRRASYTRWSSSSTARSRPSWASPTCATRSSTR